MLSGLLDKVSNKFHQVILVLWPFENLGILNLSARYLENYLCLGLETWLADKVCWVDYRTEICGNLARYQFGHI